MIIKDVYDETEEWKLIENFNKRSDIYIITKTEPADDFDVDFFCTRFYIYKKSYKYSDENEIMVDEVFESFKEFEKYMEKNARFKKLQKLFGK